VLGTRLREEKYHEERMVAVRGSLSAVGADAILSYSHEGWRIALVVAISRPCNHLRA
jgi:hypothetical protein